MWLLIRVGLSPGIRWIVFLAIIIGYEIFEIIMSLTTKFFILEPAKDMLWDIVIALISAGIVELIFLIKGMF